MISMIDRQSIIHLYRSGDYSKRGIAKRFGISRNTVDRIIVQYEATVESGEKEALEDLLTLQPAYNSQGRKPRKLSQAIAAEIDKLLAINRTRIEQHMRKQRLLKIDMFRVLREKGIQISYATVCNYVRNKEKACCDTDSKAYIHQEYLPGVECEFDWGELLLCIGGGVKKLYLAVFTLCHSNLRRAYLFSRQDTLAFMEAHRNFFRDIGGVPSVMVYDNMRVAVKDFTGPDGKTPTEALLRMEAFYGFSHRFCNARAGWEKGHVERSVEYVRRRAFALHVDYKTLAVAQESLEQVCLMLDTEDAVNGDAALKQQRVLADMAALHTCKGDMGCFEAQGYKVDKWATVNLGGCHYSVPDSLVGKTVIVKKYSDKITVIYDKQKVASHTRIWHSGGWSLQLEHYLTTLIRKPGALAGSTVLTQVPHLLQRLFDSHFHNDPKAFLEMLKYATDNSFSFRDVTDAARRLAARGLHSLCADQIKAELHSGATAPTEAPHITLCDIMPGQQTQIETLSCRGVQMCDSLLGPDVNNQKEVAV